jgi:hypothetical protein
VAEDDGFLSRWARRKQAQKAEKTAEAAKPAATPADPATEKTAAASADSEPIDLASLPPIESLGADSDYTAFLRPGVPEAMRAAALRQLWLTEPSIRNYEALVDYAWDFNAPGYGKLLPTDDVEKLLKAVFREPEPPSEAEEKPPAAVATNVSEPPKIAAQHDNLRRSERSPPPPPKSPEPEQATIAKPDEKPYVNTAASGTARKRHGAALPKTSSETEES